MNILILTGKFGMGHYSASEAIKEEIEKEYKDAKIGIVDIIEYLNPVASRVIYGSFKMLVSRMENVYNFLNKTMGQKLIVPSKVRFVSKIDKLFEEYSPDLVISTLPLGSQCISIYKDFKKLDIPLITYITDISSHNEWIANNTDYYFVGAKSIKGRLINKGIEANKIKVTGIPVKQKFRGNNNYSSYNKKKELLIMGGGLGLIDINEMLFERLNLEKDIKTTIITGSNKKLYSYIKEKYKNINVVGYCRNVDEYMRKANIIISKAGGVTLYEAIYSEVPIYVIKPTLNQEVKNAKYIEKEQIGKVIWDKEENIDEDIISLLNDDIITRQMKNNMKKIKNSLDKDSISLIIQQLKKECKYYGDFNRGNSYYIIL